MHDADSVLQAYLRSTDETEQKQLEVELLQIYAAPLVQRTLRRRLGFYVDQSGGNPNYPDAADLYQESMISLLQKLNDLRSQPNTNHIGNFDHYVVRVAINTCNQYLRKKTPERSGLNHNLRDLMHRHRDFKAWKGQNNTILCGFAAWKNGAADTAQSISPEQSEEIIQTLRKSGLARQDLQRFPLTKIVSEIFKLVGHPIEINALSEIVATLLMIKDLPLESLDQTEEGMSRELVDGDLPPDAHIEGQEMLRQMWEEVRQMPAIQRDIVCFKFANYSGVNFFNLLIEAKIATLRELTEVFGLTRVQLAEVWKQMPMDIEALARHFGISRQQVSKLHHRALISLLDRLTKK